MTVASPAPRPDGESHDAPREPRAGTPLDRGPQSPTSRAPGGGTADDAFIALYTELYEPLCRFAWRYLRSAPGAQELVHDVFLRVWMQRARSGTAERPLPTREYLYAAIRNAAIDALRRTRSEQRALGRAAQGADAGASAVISRANTRVVDGCGAGDDAETLDLAAFIQRAIDELPARPREVLLLKWRHGLSNGEVAVELGVALKTVEMHVTRAFARLREILLPLVRGADQR